MEIWLANIHELDVVVIQQKISFFSRSTLLNIEGEEIIIHDLYKEYGKWALKHVVNSRELGGVWCGDLAYSQPYFHVPGELQSTPSGTCWQELRRICLRNISFHGFGVTKFQEWKNVVVLQITYCNHVSTLNFQDFTCLRHLELRRLTHLQTLILIEDESTFPEAASQARSCSLPKQWIRRPWLRYVVLKGLSSLELLPSFSPFSFLKYLEVGKCRELREPPRVQHCTSLKRMDLDWYIKQKTLPNLDGLTSLRDLTIHGKRHLPYFQEFATLKLEGLSSLISLGALELHNIPVGDLNGLEKLTNVEFIRLGDLHWLEDLPPLESLASSSLHVLDVDVLGMKWWKQEGERLERLIKQKLERLEARGEHVSHFPSKISSVRNVLWGRGGGRFQTVVRVPGIKKTLWCGTYSSELEARLARDAVLHYYGRPNHLMFPEITPQILSKFPLPTGLDESSMIKFVQEKAKWLASKASELRPSTSTATIRVR